MQHVMYHVLFITLSPLVQHMTYVVFALDKTFVPGSGTTKKTRLWEYSPPDTSFL